MTASTITEEYSGPAETAGLFSRSRIIAKAGFNRWLVPPAELAIHLCIGMAYGFSVFWLRLHALNRLRWMLKNQPFIRTPEGMMPTPRAEQLAQPVQMTMESIKAKGVKRLILGGAAALAAFGAVAATGIVSRARSEHEIAQWTEQQAIPTVAFVKLQQGAPVKDLILPGTIEAYYRAEALAYLHGIMGKPRPPQSRPCGGFRTSARTCAATSEAGNPAVNLRTMQKRRFEETAELFRFLGFYQQREDGQSGIAAAPVADQERSRS